MHTATPLSAATSLGMMLNSTNNNNNNDDDEDDIYYGRIKVDVVGLQYYKGVVSKGIQ